MVRLENLCKTYRIEGHSKTVARNINVTFPSGMAVAILGRNGAGKSTLMRMIAGTEDPTSGRVVSTGSISWPVGFSGSFHGDLTGQQNVRFIGRIYGVDTDALSEFVEEFAQLGKHYRLPFRTYSSGMRSRLAFGTSMGVGFDTYLVDEVTAAGDASFRSRAEAMLKERIRSAGAIMVTHSMAQVRSVCQAAAVLEDGELVYYEDLEAAIARHLRNLGV